jgi:hypothetical protein
MQDEDDGQSSDEERRSAEHPTDGGQLAWSARDNSMTVKNLTDKSWLLSRLPATIPMIFSLLALMPWALLIAGLSA